MINKKKILALKIMPQIAISNWNKPYTIDSCAAIKCSANSTWSFAAARDLEDRVSARAYAGEREQENRELIPFQIFKPLTLRLLAHSLLSLRPHQHYNTRALVGDAAAWRNVIFLSFHYRVCKFASKNL